MTERPAKRRRVELSLDDKLKIIKSFESVPKPTLRSLSEKFSIGKSTDFTSRHKKRYRSYSPTQLKNAYADVTEKGTSVYKAARLYSVPEQTPRDRICGVISPDTTRSGPGPMFSLEEENKVAEHLKLMASVGYGYTRAQVLNLGTDYATHLNKRPHDCNSLSLQWFYGFMGRWPELKLRRPKSLSELRVYATSEESITKYFDELETILEKYDLKSSPEKIYNVDEKGISMTHAPPYVVGSTDEVPIEISPERSSTVTMIGCGNALGQQIPPYFIFPGARMRQELLEGATIGTNGTVSKSGWSNSDIFQTWLADHFAKYAKVGGDKKTLLLYDGHRSHISPYLVDFAVRNGIILFVLPPHTSHILQPMDVGCFGPFSKVFSDESRKWQRSHSGTLTRYNVCSIACRAYDISLTPRNLQSAFRKSGIYPFYPTAIDSSLLKPAQYAKKRRAEQSTETASNNADISQPQDRNTVNNFFSSHLPVVHHDKPNQSKPRRSVHKVVGGKPITEPDVSSQL
ncbi:uncharacterized protein LOC121392379 [Gigantopelta aegis]|uniref:uncharacterized protein LOC121392379 n=1 Tax=Gigantopelta aegis TaxID=1735272 RepID=UPI001B88DBF0|nr:uncharacterized protein LOC121392379 [Gigantopelta aegis]